MEVKATETEVEQVRNGGFIGLNHKRRFRYVKISGWDGEEN
jgi:hypothetical protein